MAQWLTAEISQGVKRARDQLQFINTDGATYSGITGDIYTNSDQFAHILENQQPTANKPVKSNTGESVVFTFEPAQPQSLQKIAIQLQQQKPKRKQRGADTSDEEK